MISSSPITPPPELLEHWEDQHYEEGENYDVMLIQAYQAGADQELEACCQHVDWVIGGLESKELRAARRPKPPNLKEQALNALEVIPKLVGFESERDAIRQALETLPND
jgi:hypothetical protein